MISSSLNFYHCFGLGSTELLSSGAGAVVEFFETGPQTSLQLATISMARPPKCTKHQIQIPDSLPTLYKEHNKFLWITSPWPWRRRPQGSWCPSRCMCSPGLGLVFGAGRVSAEAETLTPEPAKSRLGCSQWSRGSWQFTSCCARFHTSFMAMHAHYAEWEEENKDDDFIAYEVFSFLSSEDLSFKTSLSLLLG